MKIGLVLEQFDPHRGGLEQWTWQLAKGLLKRGHEVHVVARRFAWPRLALPIVAHVLEGVGNRLAFAEAAEAKLRSLQLNVIHDMGTGWYCDVFQPHAGLRPVVAERKLLLRPRWMRPLKRRIDPLLPRVRQFHALARRQYANNRQVLVAMSQAMAEDFQRFHGIEPERIRIIYNGVDPSRFSPVHRSTYREDIRRQLGIDDGTILALIVTHNLRLKGVSTLLRTMQHLTIDSQPVQLLVVGGKRLGPWRRETRRLGVEATVTFVGTVNDTVPYYAAADVCVHPTHYDSCSLVLLEAAASGLPIITTSRFNGVAELFNDGVEGYLLDNSEDASELVGRMRDLLDASARHEMGRAARRMTLGHTFDRNVEEILAVYQEVALRQHCAA